MIPTLETARVKSVGSPACEATEEAILNALLGARTLSGVNGRTAHALTPELLRWAVEELALGGEHRGP